MQKNYKRINRTLLAVIFCIFIINTTSAFSAKLLDDTSNYHYLFKTDDIIAYEETNEFSFEGNITGLYSVENDNQSLESVNYTMLKWTIEEVTGISIKVLNVTMDEIQFDIKRHYSYSSYEELLVNENQTTQRF
jgi:hypothetical protein